MGFSLRSFCLCVCVLRCGYGAGECGVFGGGVVGGGGTRPASKVSISRFLGSVHPIIFCTHRVVAFGAPGGTAAVLYTLARLEGQLDGMVR